MLRHVLTVSLTLALAGVVGCGTDSEPSAKDAARTAAQRFVPGGASAASDEDEDYEEDDEENDEEDIDEDDERIDEDEDEEVGDEDEGLGDDEEEVDDEDEDEDETDAEADDEDETDAEADEESSRGRIPPGRRPRGRPLTPGTRGR